MFSKLLVLNFIPSRTDDHDLCAHYSGFRYMNTLLATMEDHV